jgi:predicted ArsR family transcriptional regulator
VALYTVMMNVSECLKKYGQRLDSEIAAEIGVPLSTVQMQLAGMAERGEIITCLLTRLERGRPVQGWICRVSGYCPPKVAGRKPTLPK